MTIFQFLLTMRTNKNQSGMHCSVNVVSGLVAIKINHRQMRVNFSCLHLFCHQHLPKWDVCKWSLCSSLSVSHFVSIVSSILKSICGCFLWNVQTLNFSFSIETIIVLSMYYRQTLDKRVLVQTTNQNKP